MVLEDAGGTQVAVDSAELDVEKEEGLAGAASAANGGGGTSSLH